MSENIFVAVLYAVCLQCQKIFCFVCSVSVMSKNTGTVSMAMLEKFPRDGVECIWVFLSAQIPF